AHVERDGLQDIHHAAGAGEARDPGRTGADADPGQGVEAGRDDGEDPRARERSRDRDRARGADSDDDAHAGGREEGPRHPARRRHRDRDHPADREDRRNQLMKGMIMKTTMRTLAAVVMLAMAPLAPAATTAGSGDLDTQAQALDTTAANKGQTQVAANIAAFFTTLAGSKDNAVALVTALRTGSEVTLTTTTGTGATATTTKTTFTSPTGPMGWGNVKIALALAQDALIKAGI